MKRNRFASALLVVSIFLALPGCLRVPPEPVTSSEWIVEVCRAIDRFTVTVTEHVAGFQDIFVGVDDPTDLSMTDIFGVPAEASEDVVAALVAVEPRVPEGDVAAYEVFRQLFETNAQVYQAVADTLEAFEADLGDGPFGQEEFIAWSSQISAALEPVLEQIATVEAELESFDWSSLSPKTIDAAERCEISPVPDCPDAANPTCPERVTTDLDQPWQQVFRDDADSTARDITGIGLFESDLVGDGWVHTGFSGPDDSMLALAVQTMGASCPSSTAASETLPTFGAPTRSGMGLIERPSHGLQGRLVYATDEFATSEQATQMVAALEAALGRCGHALANTPPIVANLTLEPDGIMSLIARSPFGEFFESAPTGQTKQVYLAAGPYVTLLMSDAHGIAAPVTDQAAALLGQRLQSATSAWENR